MLETLHSSRPLTRLSGVSGYVFVITVPLIVGGMRCKAKPSYVIERSPHCTSHLDPHHVAIDVGKSV